MASGTAATVLGAAPILAHGETEYHNEDEDSDGAESNTSAASSFDASSPSCGAAVSDAATTVSGSQISDADVSDSCHSMSVPDNDNTVAGSHGISTSFESASSHPDETSEDNKNRNQTEDKSANDRAADSFEHMTDSTKPEQTDTGQDPDLRLLNVKESGATDKDTDAFEEDGDKHQHGSATSNIMTDTVLKDDVSDRVDIVHDTDLHLQNTAIEEKTDHLEDDDIKAINITEDQHDKDGITETENNETQIDLLNSLQKTECEEDRYTDNEGLDKTDHDQTTKALTDELTESSRQITDLGADNCHVKEAGADSEAAEIKDKGKDEPADENRQTNVHTDDPGDEQAAADHDLGRQSEKETSNLVGHYCSDNVTITDDSNCEYLDSARFSDPGSETIVCGLFLTATDDTTSQNANNEENYISANFKDLTEKTEENVELDSQEVGEKEASSTYETGEIDLEDSETVQEQKDGRNVDDIRDQTDANKPGSAPDDNAIIKFNITDQTDTREEDSSATVYTVGDDKADPKYTGGCQVQTDTSVIAVHSADIIDGISTEEPCGLISQGAAFLPVLSNEPRSTSNIYQDGDDMLSTAFSVDVSSSDVTTCTSTPRALAKEYLDVVAGHIPSNETASSIAATTTIIHTAEVINEGSSVDGKLKEDLSSDITIAVAKVDTDSGAGFVTAEASAGASGMKEGHDTSVTAVRRQVPGAKALTKESKDSKVRKKKRRGRGISGSTSDSGFSEGSVSDVSTPTSPTRLSFWSGDRAENVSTTDPTVTSGDASHSLTSLHESGGAASRSLDVLPEETLQQTASGYVEHVTGEADESQHFITLGSTNEEVIRSRLVALAGGAGTLSRACRCAVPLQLLMILLLGVACLLPMAEEEFGCLLSNNFQSSLAFMLRYTDGSPPV